MLPQGGPDGILVTRKSSAAPLEAMFGHKEEPENNIGGTAVQQRRDEESHHSVSDQGQAEVS